MARGRGGLDELTGLLVVGLRLEDAGGVVFRRVVLVAREGLDGEAHQALEPALLLEEVLLLLVGQVAQRALDVPAAVGLGGLLATLAARARPFSASCLSVRQSIGYGDAVDDEQRVLEVLDGLVAVPLRQRHLAEPVVLLRRRALLVDADLLLLAEVVERTARGRGAAAEGHAHLRELGVDLGVRGVEQHRLVEDALGLDVLARGRPGRFARLVSIRAHDELRLLLLDVLAATHVVRRGASQRLPATRRPAGRPGPAGRPPRAASPAVPRGRRRRVRSGGRLGSGDGSGASGAGRGRAPAGRRQHGSSGARDRLRGLLGGRHDPAALGALRATCDHRGSRRTASVAASARRSDERPPTCRSVSSSAWETYVSRFVRPGPRAGQGVEIGTPWPAAFRTDLAPEPHGAQPDEGLPRRRSCRAPSCRFPCSCKNSRPYRNTGELTNVRLDPVRHRRGEPRDPDHAGAELPRRAPATARVQRPATQHGFRN